MDDDALVILPKAGTTGWMRDAGMLTAVPAQSAFERMSALAGGDAVLRSVLSARSENAARADQPSVEVISVDGRYDFRRNPDYVPGWTFGISGETWNARFFAVVPQGRCGSVKLIRSDARWLDDVPSLTRAYVVFDIAGDSSCIRWRGRLRHCARQHAAWTTMALQMHAMMLASMVQPKAPDSDGGFSNQGRASG